MGSYKPVVMFFRMTNSPVTFQDIINKTLRDIINERKVVVFMNDMLIETKTEEGHNKIVKKVLKRLEENNLYVKPEKYT